MREDKRVYSRYKVSLETKAALISGINFNLEILDISIEGARLKVYQKVSIKEGEIIYLLIKAHKNFKIKGEVKWIKEGLQETELGIQFLDLDLETRSILSEIISQYALSSLTDEYFR